jgi:hypothetical protein
MEPTELTKIAGDDNCRNGDCPTIYRTARGTPDHEAIVEIPLDLLKEAVRALGG